MPSLGLISYFLPDPFFSRGRTSVDGLAFMAQQAIRTCLAVGSQSSILNALVAESQVDGLDNAQVQEPIAEAVTILYAHVNSPCVVPRMLTAVDAEWRDHSPARVRWL
jgi:hypothetical protein